MPFVKKIKSFLSAKSAFLLCAYAIITTFCLYIAYELRFAPNVPTNIQSERIQVLWWFVPLNILALAVTGHFSILLSYYRLMDAIRTVFSMMIVAAILLLISMLPSGITRHLPHIYANSVILTNFTLCILSLTAFHTFFRLYHEKIITRNKEPRIPTAIIGAGDTGSFLLNELKVQRNLKFKPIVFIDDDESKIGKSLGGIRIVGKINDLERLKRKYGFEQVIIAMPADRHRKQVGEITELAARLNLNPAIVPSLTQNPESIKKGLMLRPVELQDLLERSPVRLNSELIAGMIKGQTIMVTGAGGSIGSELCRQIVEQKPRLLLLVEQCEVLMFQIEQELLSKGYQGIIRPLIADITDQTRMRLIFEKYHPTCVFHAAAHKHVPLMESQASEAIKNNSLGSYFLASLASEYNVQRFVLISTDKAINPTNVMGASKRMAEIFIQSLSQKRDNKTLFAAVRFGNVLGSSGSVIPIFKKQIENGGPVTVTDPDMQRYFMTIPEAVGLVLQCGTITQSGEIFVLDMGNPVKIVDVAKKLIELSGLRPGIDIEIAFVGLRPGEKLFEELQHKGEHFADTQHESIFRFIPTTFPNYEDTLKNVHELQKAIYSESNLKLLLKSMIPEYTPYLD